MSADDTGFTLFELPPPTAPRDGPSDEMLSLLDELTEKIKAGEIDAIAVAFTSGGACSTAYQLEQGARVSSLHYAATMLQTRVYNHGMNLDPEDV